MTQIQKARPVDEVSRLLSDERTKQAISSALPETLSFDRFRGAVSLAVLRTPELVQDVRGLLLACQQCASDGLLPDGREAALVVYSTNVRQPDGEWKKVPKVQYQPMVWGLMKLARNTGEISTLSARIVHDGDEFALEYGDDEHLVHRPRIGSDLPGAPLYAYAIATMRDGGREREVMSWAEIGEIMRRSKSAYPDKDGRPTKGPWASDPEEMAKKTVLRRLMKRLPRSTQLESALSRGDDIATAAAAVTPQSFATLPAQRAQSALPPASEIETIDVSVDEPEVEPAKTTRSKRITDAVAKAEPEPGLSTPPAGPTKGDVLAEAEAAHAQGAEVPFLRALLERDGLFDDAAVDAHLERITAPPKTTRRRGFGD